MNVLTGADHKRQLDVIGCTFGYKLIDRGWLFRKKGGGEYLLNESDKGAFKYYISALEGDGGLTENADDADASRGESQFKIDDVILELICYKIPINIAKLSPAQQQLNSAMLGWD